MFCLGKKRNIKNIKNTEDILSGKERNIKNIKNTEDILLRKGKKHQKVAMGEILSA